MALPVKALLISPKTLWTAIIVLSVSLVLSISVDQGPAINGDVVEPGVVISDVLTLDQQNNSDVLIVEANQSEEDLFVIETSQAEIEANIDAFLLTIPADTSLYLENLESGDIVAIGSRIKYTSASLYKLFVAYGILDGFDKGSIDRTAIVPNTEYTFEPCVQRMITFSDNLCGIWLGEYLGWSDLEQRIINEGYSSTFLNNYSGFRIYDGDKHTTAADIAKLLRRLYDGELLEPGTTAELLGHLNNQTFNERLPKKLPEGITIAHKTGELYSYRHNAGYIQNQNGADYLFVIMSGDWKDPLQANIYFPQLFEVILENILPQDGTLDS